MGLSADALAWRNVPLKERRIEKFPYRPEWVSALKKGKFFKYKRKEYSSPRVSGEYIFIGSDGGYFYAMKKKNGHKEWRFKTTGSVNSAPAFWNDRVIFGDDDAHLYAVSIADGKEVWRAELDSEVFSAPAVAGDRVFVSTAEGTVTALSAEDGKVLWTSEHKQEFTGRLQMTIRGNSSPTVDPSSDRLYAGFSDGVVRSLSASGGKVLWEKPLAKEKGEKGFEDVDGTPLLDGDRLYVATFSGAIYALSAKNGAVLWSQPPGSAVHAALMGDTLIVAASNGHLFAYQKKDGSKIWESPIGHGALTAPVVYKDLIAVGLSDETMNFVDSEDGHVIARRFAKKGIYSDPIVDEDRIYYLSNGGRLYSLRLVR
jgi:outer membrane protein assembly factor BamB